MKLRYKSEPETYPHASVHGVENDLAGFRLPRRFEDFESTVYSIGDGDRIVEVRWVTPPDGLDESTMKMRFDREETFGTLTDLELSEIVSEQLATVLRAKFVDHDEVVEELKRRLTSPDESSTGDYIGTRGAPPDEETYSNYDDGDSGWADGFEDIP